MGSQSKAKTIFLLISMAGWLLTGAALMYLFPAIAHLLLHRDRTALWLETLGRSGYNPMLGTAICVGLIAVEIIATWVWYRRFDGRL